MDLRPAHRPDVVLQERQVPNTYFNKRGDTLNSPFLAGGIMGANGAWTGLTTSETGLSNQTMTVTANQGSIAAGRTAWFALFNAANRAMPAWEDAYAGGAVFEIDDPENPTLNATIGGTGGTAQTGWVRGHVAVQVGASDPGLGVWRFLLDAPRAGGGDPQRPYDNGCTGQTDTSPCPATLSQSLDLDTATMPDGVNAVSATVMDAGLRIAPWRGWNLKVDKRDRRSR